MGDFYMTLPSNSSTDVYPNNNASEFQTKLPQTYHLNDYEVGLAEIQLPSAQAAIKEPMYFAYQHHDEDAYRTYKLPSGFYEGPQDVVDHLNYLMENKLGRNRTKFIYDKRIQRTKLHVAKKEKIALGDIGPFLQLPPDAIVGEHDHVSLGDMNVERHTQTLYVYCDLVTNRQVGDVSVPLLRTVPTLKTSEGLIYQFFEKPHYIPLSRSTFESVEVNIKTGKGEKPHFVGDIDTVVTLHLRPRRYKPS